MNPYIAPLEEIRFVLNHLTNLGNVAEIMNSESLADEELVNLILEQAARFAQEVLAPLDSIGDQTGAHYQDGEVSSAPGFKDAYEQYIEAGWNNVSISGDFGGQGFPNLMCAALIEMFVSANKAFCYTSELTKSGVKTLASSASPELKERFIPKLVTGEWTATMNLTEPQAGSDVGALKTRAELQEDGTYRIFGQKIFISAGEHDLAKNIVHLVLARIQGAPEGSRGVSLFVVPKFIPESGARNDVVCTGIEHKLGNHGSPTCTMVYGEKGKGARAWLVGEENKGLSAMFVMVNASRLNVGMEAVSIAEKAYQQSLLYAQERIQGRLIGEGPESVPIIKHPDVRRMLLLMRSQTEAIRALGYVLAEARDVAEHSTNEVDRNENQALVDILIPIFKGWASETAIDVTSTSIQVHGGLGYVEESGVSQAYRDHRIAAIYEGTTGIQAHDLIERKFVRHPKTYEIWQERMRRCLVELNQSPSEELRSLACDFEQALTLLDTSVNWVIENYKHSPLHVLSGSVPFLRLCGIVAGGWQMARAAIAAQKLIHSGAHNSKFLLRKIASAKFYFAHVLAEIPGLAAMTKNLGDATLALDEAAF